jgi:hypothetical protein
VIDNLADDWNDKISSTGPDKGTFCTAYPYVLHPWSLEEAGWVEDAQQALTQTGTLTAMVRRFRSSIQGSGTWRTTNTMI